jgi:predicted transposase/invertase (TIGR01784 family)
LYAERCIAALSKTSNPEKTLRQIAKQIENIADKTTQSNVAASMAIISGIALNKEIIQRLLRSEIMKESVIYQDILLEGIAEGEARGISKGKAEEKNQIALKMLRSNIPVDAIAEFTGLTLKQIEKLQKLATKQPRVRKTTKPKRSPQP